MHCTRGSTLIAVESHSTPGIAWDASHPPAVVPWPSIPKRAFSRGAFSLGAVRRGLSPFIRQMSAV